MSNLTDSIDQTIEALRPAFIAAQENFKATHGRYWQGRATHDVLPAEGVGKPIKDLDRKPDSEPFGWRNFAGGLPPNLRASLTMDNYDGHKGQGFLLHVTLKETGRTMTKTINHGPMTERETDWTDIMEKGEGEKL